MAPHLCDLLSFGSQGWQAISLLGHHRLSLLLVTSLVSFLPVKVARSLYRNLQILAHYRRREIGQLVSKLLEDVKEADKFDPVPVVSIQRGRLLHPGLLMFLLLPSLASSPRHSTLCIEQIQDGPEVDLVEACYPSSYTHILHQIHSKHSLPNFSIPPFSCNCQKMSQSAFGSRHHLHQCQLGPPE